MSKASDNVHLKFNNKAFIEEMDRATDILKRNRHNVFNGVWYGPDPEPMPAGVNCDCTGCKLNRSFNRAIQS